MPVSGTAELRLLIAAVGKLPTEIRKELRLALRNIGQPALAGVRREASWSKRIPPATRLQIGLATRQPGIAIVVNAKKAPHARPLNHGDQPGLFRHPVFFPRKRKMVFGVERPKARVPNRWVNQQARPFLVKGAQPHFDKADRELARAVDAAARKAGFK